MIYLKKVQSSIFSFRKVMMACAVIALVAVLAVIGVNSVKISNSNAKIQYKQLDILTNLLISQASMSASHLMATNNLPELQRLVDDLTKEALVENASVYDEKGSRLISSHSKGTVRDFLGYDAPLNTANIGFEQLVSPIVVGNKLSGFIRLTFNTGKIKAISEYHYRKTDRYMYTMIGMSFMIGMLFCILYINWKKIVR